MIIDIHLLLNEVIHIKIKAVGNEKISVTLTENDMRDFDITYDELDYSNIETRRVIWTILDEATRVLGRRVNIENRLLIQAMPCNDGGCFLEFTQLPKNASKNKKYLVLKKESEPLLFKTFNENSFIDSIKIMKNLAEFIEKCEVYKHFSNYCALIHPKIKYSEKIVFVLSEYGEISSPPKNEIAEIQEHGTFMCEI